MKNSPHSLDWSTIDLVVFDLDGVLYARKRLQVIMTFNMLYRAVKLGSLNAMRILWAFRNYQEVLDESAHVDLVSRRFEATAFSCDCSVAAVHAVVREWIDMRPLPYLRSCRLPGVAELFYTLRRTGKTIAVLSDYPAEAKLKALALRADIVVSATDGDVRCFKPSTRGLLKILDKAGVKPTRAIMIGDRYERNGAAAARVGMQTLLLAQRKDDRCITFRSYDDDLFLRVAQSRGVVLPFVLKRRYE